MRKKSVDYLETAIHEETEKTFNDIKIVCNTKQEICSKVLNLGKYTITNSDIIGGLESVGYDEVQDYYDTNEIIPTKENLIDYLYAKLDMNIDSWIEQLRDNSIDDCFE